jgi:hypothetical protein
MIDDFADPERLACRERELARHLRPAGEMYTGQQHLRVMTGVRLMRQRLGHEAVQVAILSAGYGLIPEDRLIGPYDLTFKTMGRPQARSWARRLGVAESIRRAIQGYDLVFVLLGSDYLDAIDPPLTGTNGQRLVFFAPLKEAKRIGMGTLVPAGPDEGTRFGAGLIALKGRMLELLGSAVLTEGASLLDQIAADQSPKPILAALDRTVRRS